MANVTKKPVEADSAVDSEGWEKPLIPPIVPDGWVKAEPGTTISGVVLERGQTEFGPYYAIKLSASVAGKDFDKKPCTFAVGQIVAITEISGLRPLAERITMGPTAVRITCTGKNGNRYMLDVRCKPAF